jgi:integrase
MTNKDIGTSTPENFWSRGATYEKNSATSIQQFDINGIQIDKELLTQLLAKHLGLNSTQAIRHKFSQAFEIYLRERSTNNRKRFTNTATRSFNNFVSQFGDLYLDEIKHLHGIQYRDAQLARGLNPTSVRKHFNTLNAVLNLAFKHLDIDRLSPFRALHIAGVDEVKRPMRIITPELLHEVKQRLLTRKLPYRLVALVQLNTGMRVSEPIFARREDLILKHEIPHIWVRKNALTDRKTKSSIRAIPLVGVSLDAARALDKIAELEKSEWLVPRYAHENGNSSCSAVINKHLRDLEFRSHMFRHALIDRLKACNDIPTRLAESITGHSSGGSDFNTYGTVGYTLEQKLEVLQRIKV